MALAPASRAGGPYLSSIGRVLPGVRNEPQQDFADYQRLVAVVQAVQVQEPERQAIRAELLAKLAALAKTPAIFRGTWQAG